MATRIPQGPTISSGRRGYLRYQYGDHYWIPEIMADFSKGMVRDVAREAIPAGAVYDSADYLLDQPGVARKRGGTSYAGPALSGAGYVTNVKAVPFLAGAQLLAVGSNSHLFKITAGATTDLGAINSTQYGQMTISPGAQYLIMGDNSATQVQKYDGSAISSLDGVVSFGHTGTYKARVFGCGNGTNRIYFSPVPDVNATWDFANSWIDCDSPISGFATLNNAILVFSAYQTERIIGATPPPNSDMDRAPLAPVGCTDSRSIVSVGPYVYFASPQGVFMTNGSTPVSLTADGGIANYWRNLFAGYMSAAPVPNVGSWTIAAGFWRGFLFVSVLDASRTLVSCLMCQVATRAWWRLTNINASCWATAVDGNELYYGDAQTNRVVAMSNIFTPAAANKNDANGTAVTPAIEFAPAGAGVGVKSYGFGHLDYDLRDAASDNPALAVTLKNGVEADTVFTPAESPLLETTTLQRPRFTISRTGQAMTVSVAQTGPSAKTELYALEVMTRPQPYTGEGVT